jgi:subtilase family serine protease
MSNDRRRTFCTGVLGSLAALVLAVPAFSASGDEFAAIAGSFRPTTDVDMGKFSSEKMTVEVVLAPSNQADLDELLASVYDPKSPNYQLWLVKGEFYSRFAPSAERIAAVAAHLQSSGLVIEESSSPFLVRASGPSSTVEAAFATNLHNYRNSNGVTYFANASAIKLPAQLAAGVLGVVGITNTIRVQAHPKRALTSGSSAPSPVPPFCNTPYPTTTQFFADVNSGTPFANFGYGDGPLCSGLTPSQDNAIYGAPHLGNVAKGLGVNLAVFELSAYQHSDIEYWAHHFYGPGYTPPLVDIDVDGGPLHPKCPRGDECTPGSQGYSGDVEVDADIQTQLAIAPAARKILVYNAPNDETGQTSLDEYTRIASDNIADVISSSWGLCENDVSAAYVQAENIIFEQMALQGQSMFAAAGDDGAFDCIVVDENGTIDDTFINVDDPEAQPWVTSVGGTSFFAFNPDANSNPSYPTGVESVWNVDNLCSNAGKSAANDKQGGFFWCANTGAGGGGSSQYWGRLFYQFGPGITNPYTTYGNGKTHCALAKLGTPCREVPDVSLNADEFTPYAEYCTPAGSETYSGCAQPPIGWFGIGGTSLSSPFWSAIIADRDGLWHGRIGNANPLLYLLYNLDYHGFFHDITGTGKSYEDTIFPTNNGHFPATPGYDLATGIGTPKMGAIITGVPER